MFLERSTSQASARPRASSGPRAWLIRGSLAALALCGVMAGEAQARIFIGLGVPLFFPPVVVAPPAYYPPYYPPPVVYAPPGGGPSYAPPAGQPQSLTPPPGYYPPQGGYTPQEGYTPSGGYAPSQGAAEADGAQSCHAGAYVCPLVEDTPPGGACACPGHDGRRIRGQAD
jgi:hypothetical protein